MRHFDYVIVGSGIAGLYTALLARDYGSVLILTKGSIEECNTRYAQGGIAAAIGPGDSPQLHMQDTLAAGAGLTEPGMARILAEEAADRIADLIHFGVPFDSLHGEIALGREGAHSASRILHAGGDATGQHIEISLSRLARMSRITIQEYGLVTEVLVEQGHVRGVVCLDTRTNTLETVTCRYLILATGGAGRLYRHTTNPEVATGDGVALAYGVGAEIQDMEFYQFHPTALRLPGVPPFLISEAVRGEGGILRTIHGEAFMPRYSPQADLAPRDVVARAIVNEMRSSGSDHVLLDVTHLKALAIPARFPQIYRSCMERGLDITTTPIPVAPAAHYMMGGVRINAWGETNVPGLLACGEAACTGVHGANRLASNSLLEVVIFGKRMIHKTVGRARDLPVQATSLPVELHTPPTRQPTRDYGKPPDISGLQALMWDKVGIVRDGQGLLEAAETLAAWAARLGEPSDRPSHELRHMLLAARLITEAALLRQESRGAHYRTDFPHPRPEWLKHLVFQRPT